VSRSAVLAMLLILFVCLGNFAVGFVLAVHFGHGPPGVELPRVNEIRNRLRSLLGRSRSA
jgi:hypothetical protein